MERIESAPKNTLLFVRQDQLVGVMNQQEE